MSSDGGWSGLQPVVGREVQREKQSVSGLVTGASSSGSLAATAKRKGSSHAAERSSVRFGKHMKMVWP